MGYTEITIWLVSHTTTHTGFNINVREGMHICCNEYKSNHCLACLQSSSSILAHKQSNWLAAIILVPSNRKDALPYIVRLIF